MKLVDFNALLSEEGQMILQDIGNENANDKTFLSLFQRYSKKYPKELVRSALSIAISRGQASKKYPFSKQLYTTKEAVQQASSWVISQHRAKRFKGFEKIIDLGCSIGTDTLALGEIAPTIGMDIDPLRLAMARENANIIQTNTSFLEMDINQFVPSIYNGKTTAIFFDPARRAHQNRIFNVEQYTPPLSIIKNWLPFIPNIGVKISPGVKIDQLRDYDCEIEFISLKGELKEAVLWFGSLKKNNRQATLLPSGNVLTSNIQTYLPITPPRKYIYEPDPAIIRSGLLTTMGEAIGASKIHDKIAYLTNDSGKQTPYAIKWEIESWMPFQLKKLRKHLRELDIGILTVKKRGSPIEPATLIKQMKLSGSQERVLFLTMHSGKPIVIIAFPHINPSNPTG